MGCKTTKSPPREALIWVFNITSIYIKRTWSTEVYRIRNSNLQCGPRLWKERLPQMHWQLGAQDKAPSDPPVPGQTSEPTLVATSQSGNSPQDTICAYTALTVTQGVSGWEVTRCICPFVTGSHRNQEPGVRKKWKKIICLKEENGETTKMNIKERGRGQRTQI